MNRMRPRLSQPSQGGGRTDLLLRLFDSDFFDAWLALTYIYQKKTGGVHDYLCNKLCEFPERDIERYLSQFCHLIVSRPGSALEKVIIDLCARSLRIAVKIFWLFKAICQDQPKNRHAREVMDKCEIAALNGSWVLPFKSCALEPMSPMAGSSLPPTPIHVSMTPKVHGSGSTDDLDSLTPSCPGYQLQNTSSTDINRPISPVYRGSISLCSSHDLGQGLEGLIGTSPSVPKDNSVDLESGAGMDRSPSEDSGTEVEWGNGHFERCRVLHETLGRGEGVTELLQRSTRNAREGGTGCVSASEDDPVPPPSSPQLRKTTFGATLDFVDALCNASSSLVHVPQDMRKKALQQALMDINAEIDLCASKNVAVWFPMGTKNERVLRLVANDAIILNSREKVPFMLFVEVLHADGGVEDGNVSEAENYADSAHSIMHMRSDSNGNSGSGPMSHQELMGSLADQQYVMVDRVPPQEGPEMLRAASRPQNGRTLSESSAWKGEMEPEADRLSTTDKETGPPIPPPVPSSFSRTRPPPAPPRSSTFTGEEIKELNRAGISGIGNTENSFTRRIDTAMASLRGDAPLVRLNLTVLEDVVDQGGSTVLERQDSSEDIVASGNNARTGAEALVQKDDEGISTSKALALLSKFGLCRTTCLDLGINGEWYSPAKEEKRVVTVNLEVIGGVNLRIPSPSKRRRVPSQEALDYLKDKKLPNLPPPAAQFGLDLASRTWSERSEASSVISMTPSAKDVPIDDLRARKKQRQANEVYGLRWTEKVESIQKQSPHGRRKGWGCKCVIVKSGDDCRQELLAIQLIETFQQIFHEAKLPLWVRPYEVLVTSNRTALIEFIPDSLSIHTIKHRSPAGTSLSQHFFNKFKRGTPECLRAQRCFVESTAAYSIISYLLQFKDRHNGNLLVDDEGHLIHIDFGFMLGIAPGGINFEAAPFKLTREFLEIMDSNSEGKASEAFDYFKVLFIQGFLACRKHADRILTLCEMMSKAGFPCFKTGDRVLKNLKKRFHLNCPEEQSIQVVMGLTSDSLDAWRTRQYDYYQRLLNGIL